MFLYFFFIYITIYEIANSHNMQEYYNLQVNKYRKINLKI